MTAEALEEKVNAIEILLTKVDSRSKSNTTRLDEVETELKENSNLIGAIKELAIETKYMREDLNKASQRIDKLENKDSDSWNKFKWIIVAGMVTILVGYIAVQIGLK